MQLPEVEPDVGYQSQSYSEQPLAKSLQEWQLRKKRAPAAAEPEVIDANGAKQPYDRKKFAGSKSSSRKPDSMTEQDYFNEMKRFHDDDPDSGRRNKGRNTSVKAFNGPGESFRGFLSSSFTKTFSRDRNSRIRASQQQQQQQQDQEQPEQQQRELSVISSYYNNNNNDPTKRGQGHIERPNDGMIEPEPAVTGIGRRARDFLSSSFNGLLIMMPGFGHHHHHHPQAEPDCERPPVLAAESGGGSRWSQSRSQSRAWQRQDSCDCKDDGGHCDLCHSGNGIRKKRKERKLSCGTLFCLVAIDVFTLGLIIILYSQLHVHTRKDTSHKE